MAVANQNNGPNYEQLLDTLTGTDKKGRDRLLKYAAKLPDRLVARAMSRAVDFYYNEGRDHRGQGQGVVMLTGFLNALRGYHMADVSGMRRKGSKQHIDTLNELELAREEVVKKQRSPVTSQLLPHIEEIKTEKSKGSTLREIAAWLFKIHKIKVSHETVRKIL
jgi:hypothetical protein